MRPLLVRPMTAEPTYTPSPELVEALARELCETDGMEWDEARGGGDPDVGTAALAYAVAAENVLTAAVAYRTPTGDPELVPWEQVRELVEAVQEAEPWLDYLDTNHAPDWAPNEASIVAKDLARLRAALAPFTQEPQP